MTEWLTALFTALAPLWEMSLTAAFAAVAVLVLRLLLKGRAPRQVVCLLWLIVFVRLLIPVSLESPVSLVPQALTEQSAPAVSQPVEPPSAPVPAIPTGSAGETIPAVSRPPSVNTPVTGSDPVVNVDVSSPPVTGTALPYGAVLAVVWLLGAAAMLLYGVLSYVRLRRRVFDAIRAEDGAWEHPAVRSPFILGLFRPRIYLPAGLNGPARGFILCHEQAHLRRLDHIVKPVCWLALAIHWFNPMAWVAFLLMSRDMEVACDQTVIRQLGEGVKADYSATLLSLASGGRFPAPTPLAFGEGDAKARIKSVLSYKKPTLWIIVAAVVVAIIAAVCLLTDPKAPTAEEPEPSAAPSAQPTEPPTLPTGPDGAELTLLDMDTASGTCLYADSKGLVSVLSNGRMGYVYVDGELLALKSYSTETISVSLLFCGVDPNGYWQVTIDLESDTQLLVTAFLYWYEPEQVWSTNLPSVTVTPVTLLEGSTYYYTGFELDTPVGSRSFTGAHVDGQPTLTYCSDLTGDGVGEYIVMLYPGDGTGPVKHDLHIFDGVTLEEYDTSGVWRLIPEMVEFTSDEANYYITAPSFAAAISKAQVQAQLTPLNAVFDTMEFSGEICWLSVEEGRLCVSYACMVGDFWTSYGTLRAELAVVDGTLVAEQCYYIGPDGIAADGTHTVEVTLEWCQYGSIFGRVEPLAEPFVFQITVPGQFRSVTGSNELAEVDNSGKIVGQGPSFALMRVRRDFVLDEAVGQTQQLITSGGVYVEDVSENAEISRYTTAAGYDAVIYEYEFGDQTSLYAFIRIAPEYVLHVSLRGAEIMPIRYAILNSILVEHLPGESLSLDTYQNRLAAGTRDFYAIQADGTLIMWGSPEYGLEGSAMFDVPMASPLELMGNVAYVSAAMGRVTAIDKNGTLWGLGTMADPAAPNQPRRLMEDVAMVSCGQYDTLVLKQDGTLWSCNPFSPGLPGLERQIINGVTFEKLMDQVIYVKTGGVVKGTVILADHTEWIWDQYSGLEKLADDVYLGTSGQFARYGVRIDAVADSADGEFESIVLKKDGTLWRVTSDGSLIDISFVLR